MNGAKSLGEFGLTQTGAMLERLEREAARTLAWGDAESVHDLRVAVRRFDQALRIFDESFAPGESKPIRKELKKLMKLASQVRDHDIALEFLDERQDKIPVPDELRAAPEAERTELAGELIDALQRWKRAELPAAWRTGLLRKSEEGDPAGSDQNTAAAARPLLARLAGKYFKAGRKAIAQTATHRDMHRFRLKTKRFRYTLELFRPVYGEELQARLKLLQELQRRLGKMSDAFAIRRLVKRDAALALELKLAGNEELAQFRDYWRNEFDAAGEQQAWETTLGEIVETKRNVKMV